MQNYSDEPVLIKSSRRFSTKHWIAIALTLCIAGGIVFIPINNALMEERAHDAKRGPHNGTLYDITVDGKPRTLELTWSRGHFAPVLTPPPEAGVTLQLTSRLGTETLAWHEPTFGPATTAIDPSAHYHLDLTLIKDGRTLWQDSLWAYGYIDPHGHGH
jgi:hypothetical protein